MNLTISIKTIIAARKLLIRHRFERFTLPVFTHVLAVIDNAGLTLTVTDLDPWHETRIPATILPFTPGRFLIPAEALRRRPGAIKEAMLTSPTRKQRMVSR